MGGKLGSVEERFWAKVDKSGPVLDDRPELGQCWLWTASTSRGYGVLQVGTMAQPKMRVATRISVELATGQPVPEDYDVDHLCRRPLCVNPAHLEPVTHRVNMLRGNTFAAAQAARTECPQGHPYDEVNTRVRSTGKRDCRACDREAHRRRRAQRQGACVA